MIRDPFDPTLAAGDLEAETPLEEWTRRARERFARETGGHPDDAPIVEADFRDLR